MTRILKTLVLTVLFSGITYISCAQEVTLASADAKKLDPFEQQHLTRADKLFDDKQYRGAAAEYDAFLLEFPGSSALPYALLRKARSIDLDNKRYQAIKSYQEVLDYFPNNVAYAAPALYYIGQCHWGNGDLRNAMLAWRKMADDPQYSKHFLACNALKMLAENFEKQDEITQAVKYYSQAASTFRRSNANVARDAMRKVVDYQFRINPNAEMLRRFFDDVQGFEHNPQNLPKEEDEIDRLFWSFVIGHIHRYGGMFDENSEKEKKDFYAYWSRIMQNKYPDWVDFQLAQIEAQYRSDGNERRKFDSLDRFLNRPENKNNPDTIIKAIGICGDDSKKIEEYYAKLDFGQLDNSQKIQLMFILAGYGKYQMAMSVFSRLDLADMNDQARYHLMRRLWEPVRQGMDMDCLVRVSESYNNLDNGRMELLEFIYRYKSSQDAMPVVDALRKSPNHASRALYLFGIMYQRERKYQEAIDTFYEADNPPDNLFRIVDCYNSMDRLNSAAETTMHIENFFPGQAARASLRRAYLYRDAKMEEQYVAGLRYIMNKYPKSSESSTAHVELQKMGIATGGAVAADK